MLFRSRLRRPVHRPRHVSRCERTERSHEGHEARCREQKAVHLSSPPVQRACTLGQYRPVSSEENAHHSTINFMVYGRLRAIWNCDNLAYAERILSKYCRKVAYIEYICRCSAKFCLLPPERSATGAQNVEASAGHMRPQRRRQGIRRGPDTASFEESDRSPLVKRRLIPAVSKS